MTASGDPTLARGAKRPHVSIWNVANAVTLLRLAMVPLFAVLLLLEDGANPRLRFAAALVFTLAAVTDLVDGEIARRWGIVTDMGKIADPIADKALIGMALVGLSMLGELAWWVTVLVLARELAVTVLRLWALQYGVIAANFGGKLKTVLQSVGLGLYLLPLTGAPRLVAGIVLGAAVVVTLASGLQYAYLAVRLRASALRQREASGG